MKKLILSSLITAIVILFATPAFAGSVPEDLLHSDTAEIFFAEVISYAPDGENPKIELSPVKKVKGDVKIGETEFYREPSPTGDFIIKTGNTYLFAYFDENNPTYVFETNSTDTKTLTFKNSSADMWARFLKYLNNGDYEKAEEERLKAADFEENAEANAETAATPEESNDKNHLFILWFLFGAAIGVCAIAIFISSKNNKNQN